MAADVAELSIKVTNAGVDAATRGLLGLESAGAKAETRMLALKAAAATVGLAMAGMLGRKVIEETEQAQAAAAQLEAALRSTGGAAGFTAAQLQSVATSLSRVSTFGDDAIVSAQALLATFTNIRGDEFNAATVAVLDMSVALGQDLRSSALQVGKALNDPIAGVTALSRAGVQLSDSQKETIKRLAQTGQVAEAQRVILKELETQMGGSAAAARNTLGGALKALSNAWGDLFEVSRDASNGAIASINALTTALGHSGLSMSTVLKDAAIDWDTMRASIQKVKEIMSLQIGPGFLDQARNIIQRIDFDLSAKIADLNAPAKPGPPPPKPPPRTVFVDAEAAKQATRDIEALQKATDGYYNTLNQNRIDAINVIGTMREQNDATREMIEAYRQGPAAIEALTVAQAGNNAVRELGIGVSEKMKASVRGEAEEQARLAIELGKVQDAQAETARKAQQAADEAQRAMERRARELHRNLSGAIEGALTDVSNGRNPLLALVDGFKRALIRALSEALAERALASKFAAMLGVGATRSSAADLSFQTAMIMRQPGWQMSTGARGGVADASVVLGGGPGRTSNALGYGAIIAGAGTTAYGVGSSLYSTSHGAFGNYARGAIGGATAGALAGATLGTTVFPGIGTAAGAAAGAIVGLTAGLFGMASAAKASAAAVRDMRAGVAATMEALRAEVSRSSEAAALAQIRAQSATARKQIEDAYSGGGRNSETVRQRNALLEETNRLEAQRIAQLQEEAAAMRRYFTEDLQVRELRAKGRDKEASDLEFQNRQQRELDEYRRTHDMTTQESRDQYAYLQYVQSLEKNTAAINGLTTAMRGAPSGFKVEPYIQQFARALPQPRDFMPPGLFTPPRLPVRPPFAPAPMLPQTPFAPPMSPLSPPQLSRTGMVGTAPINVTGPITIHVDGSKDPALTAREVKRVFLAELDKTKSASVGLNGTRAQALEVMS